MLRRLIINADDFGLSPGANRAIREAHLQGVVNSASLMANMSGFEEALAIARSCPSLDVGVHIVLAAGRPVSAPDTVSSLVDDEGRFLRRRALLLRIVNGRARYEDVEREVRAQVGRILDAGLRPSHLDGDQHVHVFPLARDAALKVAQDLGAAVRIPSERILFRSAAGRAAAPMAAGTLILKVALRALASSLRRQCRRLRIPTNDHFLSLFGLFPRRPPNAADLATVVASLSPGVTELMVHPAFPDAGVEGLWKRERSVRDRALEFDALSSERFRQATRSSGACPTTYGELCRLQR